MASLLSGIQQVNGALEEAEVRFGRVLQGRDAVLASINGGPAAGGSGVTASINGGAAAERSLSVLREINGAIQGLRQDVNGGAGVLARLSGGV